MSWVSIPGSGTALEEKKRRGKKKGIEGFFFMSLKWAERRLIGNKRVSTNPEHMNEDKRENNKKKYSPPPQPKTCKCNVGSGNRGK